MLRRLRDMLRSLDRAINADIYRLDARYAAEIERWDRAIAEIEKR